MTAFKFKVILLGAANVGKTSLMHRFVNEIFQKDYAATIGAQFLTKSVNLNGHETQLNIWDIAGQKGFRDLRTTFYRGANGGFLVFDLTREETFKELNEWYEEMVPVLPNDLPIIIIGNKLDLVKKKGREIQPKDAENFANNKNSIYLETSAKNGNNVEKAFLDLARFIASKEGLITLAKEKPKKLLKKSDRESYIVKSKIKNYIKSQGCNTSKELLNGDALNNIIKEILDAAIERSKLNNRKTVQSKDI